MKKITIYLKYILPALILGFICCYFFCCYVKSPVTTIILIRHADRAGSEDQLNSAGEARAQELVRILDEANISAIYASSANRAQQTANPLATQLGLSILTYDSNNLQALVNEIKNQHRGKVVLVVGHSDTVPVIIGLLGIQPAPGAIPGNEFDNLFIVTLNKRSIPRMIKIEYGAYTP
jgi:broad specificity phosphatase PhoE